MRAGVAAGIGGLAFAPRGGRLRSTGPIVIAVAPYRSIEELAAAAYPLNAEPALEAKRSAHTALYAARELRRYLCRLTNVDPGRREAFPISLGANGKQPRGIFLVDLSSASARGTAPAALARERLAERLPSAESFALVPDGPRLYLVGRDRAGLLYSVYHFLEMQGVRWYAPGEAGEVVPAGGQITFPVATVVEQPAFMTRGFFAWEPRGDAEFHAWMARNRLNYWTIADKDHAFMNRAGLHLNAGSHWILESFLNPADEYPFQHEKFAGAGGKPKDPYPTGAGYAGDTSGDGKLSYFEAHPEWYGLFNGKRTPFQGVVGVNICSSNHSVMTELCRRIVQELAHGQWRDVDILEFWVLDVGKWCQCPNCEALGTPTDRLLLMVHQVRQAIARAVRDGLLSRDPRIFFPIYMETLPAPTRPLPEGFDYQASIGTLFPIMRCFGHAMDDPACTETNVPIWRTILGWQNGERFYRGEYVMGEYYNVSTTKSLPVLYTKIMAHDIPMYRKHGVRHFHFMHAYTRLMGPKRLNQFLMAKLLWNDGVDVAALADRYYADFYGAAAKPMKEFYERLEYAMSAIAHWKSGPSRLTRSLAKDLDPLFPLQHLQLEESHPPANDGVDLVESVAGLRRCRAIMDEVLPAVPAGVIRERLLEDDRNLRYAENTINLYYLMAQALVARRKGDLDRAREYYRASVPHARGLKEETGIVQSSSSHANARDGMDASQIEAAWKNLGTELGVPGILND